METINMAKFRTLKLNKVDLGWINPQSKALA